MYARVVLGATKKKKQLVSACTGSAAFAFFPKRYGRNSK